VENALRDAKLDKGAINEVVLVGGSTRFRQYKSWSSLLGKDPNQTVNPDEVVAIGAAIQAGVLAGDVTGILLLDVSPLSLGETLGGVTKIIPATPQFLPRSRKSSHRCGWSEQCGNPRPQGEREMSSDNKSLGTFRLDGIPAAPRVPQIEVTFDIDANGILNHAAKTRAVVRSSRSALLGLPWIKLKSSGWLSKLNKMRQLTRAS